MKLDVTKWFPFNLCCKQKPVGPEIKICLMCLEPGATRRQCCNAPYCDHCYTKNKMCPSCNQATRQEKMTGAVYMLPVFSEHEECRVCLDPGLKRRCCDKYYCDDCYYSQPVCRSCQAPVGKKEAFRIGKTALIPIIIGWLVTVFVGAVFTAVILIVIANDAAIPKGVFGFKCYGFFPKCELEVCVGVSYETALGLAPLQPLQDFRACDVSSPAKIRTLACVYDSLLYGMTSSNLGYDLCSKEFAQGSYIFEDDFETWTNVSVTSNKMKSAYWGQIYNGYSTSLCGTPPGGGVKSLSFAGAISRYAATVDLDVSTGGWIEAEILIPGAGFNTLSQYNYPYCKTDFGGLINVEYSINEGLNWTTVYQYDPTIWRNNNWFFIKHEVPAKAMTASTRFRFAESTFSEVGDNWAIDNVRVFRYFPSGWSAWNSFKANVVTAWNEIQKAQCCFDTDWCIQRLSLQEMQNCGNSWPWFTVPRYNIHWSESIVGVAALVVFIKFIYKSVMEFLMRKRFPFQDEVEELAKVDRIMKYIPPRWRPRKKMEDYVSNIHMAARLEADMRAQFEDAEAQHQETSKQEEEEKKKKENKEKAVLQKKKKRLKKLMSLKGFVPTDEQKEELARLEEEVSDEEDERKEDVEKTKFGSEKMADDKDKFKRGNAAMLRIPFNTKVDYVFRRRVIYGLLCVYGGLVFAKIVTTAYYILNQTVRPYNAYESTISLTSFGVNLLAFILDGKEIWHALKYALIARDDWIPLVTLDLTEDVRSLYIGPFTIELDNIVEFNTYSATFIKGVAGCYIVGSLPWVVLSLIIRDHFLYYSAMIYVTPLFGAVIVGRAIMGPGIFYKSFYAFSYLFDINMRNRETIGKAFQAEHTRNSALNASIALTLFAAFVIAAVSVDMLAYAVAGAFLGGAAFGAFSGCYHSLPIRPWMYITTLEDGVWLRLKRKTQCPCKYWGSYCTEIHVPQENFIIYPTDPIKFYSSIKGGSRG